MKKASFLLFSLIFLASITQVSAMQTNGSGKTATIIGSTSAGIHIPSDNGKPIAAVSGVAIAGPSAQPVVQKQEDREVFSTFFDNLESFFKSLFRFF